MEPALAHATLPMLGAVRPERADAARNRAAILDAAGQLVGCNGVEAVTMDEVACAAKVGKGTLFRAFGDRAGLLRALLDERERAFQEEFIRGPAPLGPGAPPEQRLCAFGERMLDRLELDGDLVAAAETGVPGQRLRHAVYGTYRAFVVGLLEDIGDGSVQDVGYLADALLAVLAADLVLHQRRVMEMPRAQQKQGWAALVAALAGSTCAGERP